MVEQNIALLNIQKNTDRNTSSEIWAAFQNGSNTAFKSIYDQYSDMLYGYGRRLTPETELIKDCLQDLFVDLWNTRMKLGKVTNIKAYLFVSFRRKLLVYLKKQRKEQHLTIYEIDDIGEESANEERQEKISSILSSMSERQREALFLRFYSELSCQEIAEILNINAQSVYNLLHKGITTLRKNLLVVLIVSKLAIILI